ncbi:type VII secretion-associated serine protease mycosin [Amycolatopsis acidiphila]|uniref:Type VII secretion-associated serine protease mycosin n=1 Tax=Amycolatopsis acidiphila TaxID=715473 RepID=A0A557ZQA4_9PSEU|nr:type VII secretion-associated serine protease mycosin [Amycolatopsis acidiphila]TVT14206.1 type VII secretion-associated serine protease mycosin [Amycolatopsis acidiphila]UIJ60720.1 type VII secretion-associated serine protease mycosin [Amycolatopsis acidiphila]GHG91237.1 serine protease [Amycolatopsis acidiphila]
MRTLGVPGRSVVVLLAGALGVLSPLTALAQDTSTVNQPWAPPPASTSHVDDGGGQQHEIQYQKSTACVQRDLDNNIVLQEKPWGQQYMQIEQAQKLAVAARGSAGGGMKVAVIDTGVTNHPYLKFGVVGGGDYVDASKNGLEDCDGHGTEVAGIIAADTPPDIGFKGVAPDAQIVSIRQSSQNYSVPNQTSNPGGGGGQSGGANGGGSREQGQGAGNTHTLAEAVVRAANLNVNVINMSVDNCRPADGSINSGERELQAAIHYAVTVKNVVVVAAAGNTSDTCKQNDQPDPEKPQSIVSPPWFSDDVLSVAAIDETGGVASFSMNGPWVSVGAPGTNITSLDPSPGTDALANQVVEDNKQQAIQGTSFAAPYVAGVAALVRAQFPNLDPHQVMHRIEATAQHPGAPGGHDNYIGYGVINPVAALTAIVPSEEGIAPAKAEQLPSGLPPAAHKNWTPMVVALAGTGGGLLVLLVTLFVVHTIRRNRPA